MNEDFEDQLRLAVHHDAIEIPVDTDAAIRDGRRILRGRRLGWGVAACTVVAAAALVLPGLVQHGVPAVPAQPGATASASLASGRTLAGTEWNAVKLEGAELRPDTSITLRFGDGWVDGFGGCNHFGYTTTGGKIDAGAYWQDGDRLTIAPVATTAMGCGNGVGDQEGRFLQVLREVERFSTTGGLELFGSNGSTLIQFEPATPVLERSGWTVTAIKGTAPVADPRQPSLVFLEGSLYGYDGCNSINGTFSAQGDLKITVRGGTYKLCTDSAVSTQAEEFKAALEGASRVVVEGDQLTLFGSSGTVLLRATSDPARLLAAEGATWQLDNKDSDWGNVKDSGITLKVNDATLFGKSGCGDYSATYQHTGDAWTIADATLLNPLPCASTTSADSQRFLGLLAKVTTVQVTDNQLRLVTPDQTLSFSRK